MNGTSDVWQRAAIVGSLWGASEIVLGSALHNLQIPLRGYILTAIGIAILVAAHCVWPVRGLFWRAGLICASLKFLSPSSAIIGPMIAIAAEGLLLELGWVLLGRTTIGLFLGGALAMAEPLAQKIITLLIQFGSGVEKIYSGATKFIEKQFAMPFDAFWTPLILLIGATTLAGFAAVGVGLRVGALAKSVQVDLEPIASSELLTLSHKFRYSKLALLLSLLALFGGIWVADSLAVWQSALFAIAIVIMASQYYQEGFSRVLNTGFVVALLVVAILSSLLLGTDRTEFGFSQDGLELGIRMAIRAVILVTCFRAIAIELRNPAYGAIFQGNKLSNFRKFSRLAADALPFAISIIPPLQSWKHPIVCLSKMVARLDVLLRQATRPRIWLIAGESGDGKTTFVTELADSLTSSGVAVAGIVSPGKFEGGERESFNVVNIRDRTTAQLCKRGHSSEVQIGPFGFYQEGLLIGKKALSLDSSGKTNLYIVDEIGPLEWDGRGWRDQLDELLMARVRLVLTTRPSLLNHWLHYFDDQVKVVLLPHNAEDLAKEILSELSGQKAVEATQKQAVSQQ